jgi:predicted amidohydrolase
MKVAAYQAPFLPFGSFDGVALVAEQVRACAALGIDLLCCPEGIVGGHALESDGQDPNDVALSRAELATIVDPWLGVGVTTVAGFTERDEHGRLFSAAAIVGPDGLTGVYRKVYPGYRTVIAAGTDLSTSEVGDATVGVMICNDVWYVEPARILAARGAAIIVVPTNSGHVRDPDAARSLRARGRSLPIARAVDASATVVVADVAGRQGDRWALGTSVVVDPDGAVLAAAEPDDATLLVTEVEPTRRTPQDRRGWDGHTNAAVAETFLDLWRSPRDDGDRSSARPDPAP